MSVYDKLVRVSYDPTTRVTRAELLTFNVVTACIVLTLGELDELLDFTKPVFKTFTGVVYFRGIAVYCFFKGNTLEGEANSEAAFANAILTAVYNNGPNIEEIGDLRFFHGDLGIIASAIASLRSSSGGANILLNWIFVICDNFLRKVLFCGRQVNINDLMVLGTILREVFTRHPFHPAWSRFNVLANQLLDHWDEEGRKDVALALLRESVPYLASLVRVNFEAFRSLNSLLEIMPK